MVNERGFLTAFQYGERSSNLTVVEPGLQKNAVDSYGCEVDAIRKAIF